MEAVEVVEVPGLRAVRTAAGWSVEPADYEGEPQQWTRAHETLEGAVEEAAAASSTPGNAWAEVERPVVDDEVWVEELAEIADDVEEVAERRALALAVVVATNPSRSDDRAAAEVLAIFFGLDGQ